MIRFGCAMAAMLFLYADAFAQDYVENQVVVSFANKTCEIFNIREGTVSSIYPTLNTHMDRYKMKRITKLTHARKGAKNIYLIVYRPGADVNAIVEDLRGLSEVADASHNYKLEFFVNPNDYYYNHDWWIHYGFDPYRWLDQWYVELIQADKAWDITKGDPSVKVVIADTGVDYFHPDLIGNIWVNPAEDLDGDGVVWDTDDMDGQDSEADEDTLVDNLIGWDFRALIGDTAWGQDNNPYPDTLYDSARHGTMMSSFFATTNNDISQSDTSIAGISWHCKIVPMKIATSGDLISAIDHAIEIDADVVNVSAGYTGDATGIGEVVQRAYEEGIVVVAADGQWPELTYYPAACPNAVAVSGVDEDGNLCPYLGYHEYVDICGINGVPAAKQLIVTTLDIQLAEDSTSLAYPRPLFPGSQYPHTYRPQGPSTSCSSAQVSAVAALLKSLYPDATPDFIRDEILRGAVSCSTPAGRINPYRSLTQWGPIAANTTWANFAYVSADILVDSGVTLTIEPGTTIYVAADDNGDLGIDPARVVIEVRGSLIAEGTAQSPIVFKSLSQDPQPEDWYGIWFKSNSSGSLSHCRIENAKCGLKHDSEIDIEDCEVIWEQYAHVLNDLAIDEGLTLTVKPGTTVYVTPEDTARTEPDTLRVALDVKGVLNANGTANDPIVFKSSSDEPLPGDWFGIYYSDENASGSLSHCVIQDARYGIESKVSIQIADCEITNCMTAGIYMWDTLQAGDIVNNSSTIRRCNVQYSYDAAGMRIWNCPDTILVDSCTVTNNGVGIWVSNACPKITNSTASGNIYQGIWVTSYQYPAPYPRPVIRWCRMQGNDQEGIKCEYNGAHVSYSKIWENGTYGVLAYGEDADPSIDHSKIIENPAAGLRAESDANPLLGAAGTPICQNSLYGQNQQKNVYNATSQYIYAQNCWWGSAPPNLSKFYGKLYYQPYLTSDPVYYLAPMKPKMPTVLSLEQNFPNPFNGMTGTTTIKYSIPSEGEKVVLAIYDVTGRRVRTLVDKPHAPGYYYARWDGRNDRGARVAPGVYFCEMNVGKQSFTKKMVLFR